MWILTIHSPWSEPREFILKAGKTTLGRHPGNDIVISDDSASRLHAEFDYDVTGNMVTLLDLGSTNGTYVNRERISNTVRLRSDDQVRIGQHRLALTYRDNSLVGYTGRLAGTQPLSRDLVLHSVDQNALVLYEVANRLNTILDLDMALAEVAQLVQTGVGADRCEVLPSYQFGRLGDLHIPAALAHQAVEQRSIVAIPDLEAQEPASRPGAPRVRSVLCVPGIVGDEVYVLCYAYRAGEAPRPFEENAVHLMVAVCHQAALTVQRELLLERTRHLERLASTDSLTGLSNRRHFMELAEQEFQRARRYKRPLAMLMLDVNDFKHYNHRYGHAIGDLLLRAVATNCRANLRERHLVARYGGDEFVVMLIECDHATGQLVANRLCDKTAALAIDTPAGTLRVRLDAGCASLAPECTDLATLIDQAAADMAAVKQAAKAKAASYHPAA